MEDLKLKYTGRIREVEIGAGVKAVRVGGQAAFNFHRFEGDAPHLPVIAWEVWDMLPVPFPAACVKPFGEAVLNDPVAWAAKCVEEYGAEMLAVQLASIDPNGRNRPAAEAVAVLEKILARVDVPLLAWGCDNPEKDAETLKLAAEACAGRNIALGPCADKNYKQVGAAAIAYKHVVVASTPIDVNLAKQLNILLMELGVPAERIVMDPTTGALGYGIEYTYSVMERDRIAALQQQDDKLAFPMLCNLAREVWKSKEAALTAAEAPAMGREPERGIAMEALTAQLLALAGADILVMRHPAAVKLLREQMVALTE